ncbi:hypothetical protein [Haloferula sp. BvORR071]|uniref:hypothetical protein n=1 Tax=Haloferula sp. BvORR071 TaxID=1396141 RepID=UPI0005552130|nr:hypothetical protein [Haloferula sp. BvORR071]
MKLALHRSITFWSGILVMIFILWSWRQSTGTIYTWSYQGWSFGNLDSCIAMGKADTGSPVLVSSLFHSATASGRLPIKLGSPIYIRFNPTPPGPALSWEWNKNAVVRGDPGDLSSVRYALLVLAFSFTGGSVLLIPHWLLLLAFATLWIGLLLWRVRRRRKTCSEVELATGPI